ncbi:MAG: hypothetical protein JWO02_4712 [Solirubrobacterales bacterium]|nr:hypothetical protein [Solirubrobacterales bacterium]
MRARRHIALLGCLALAQGGCGGPAADAAAYTCGHMRDTVGGFRQQAQLLVDREGLKTSALSIEEAVLDVELLLRGACRGAADDYRPYARVAQAGPAD